MATHVAIKQKDYRTAVRYGEKALELEKSDGFKFYVVFHLNLASAYAKLQQDDAAAGQFELILEYIRRDQTAFLERCVQVHNQLGNLRSKQNKFDLAIVQFKESLKLDSNQPKLLHSLAHIMMNCPDRSFRDPYKAVEYARQACQLTQSKNAMYLNTLTVAYYNIKNYKEAIKAAEKAIALAQAEGDYAITAKLQKQLDLIKKTLAESE